MIKERKFQLDSILSIFFILLTVTTLLFAVKINSIASTTVQCNLINEINTQVLGLNNVTVQSYLIGKNNGTITYISENISTKCKLSLVNMLQLEENLTSRQLQALRHGKSISAILSIINQKSVIARDVIKDINQITSKLCKILNLPYTLRLAVFGVTYKHEAYIICLNYTLNYQGHEIFNSLVTLEIVTKGCKVALIFRAQCEAASPTKFVQINNASQIINRISSELGNLTVVKYIPGFIIKNNQLVEVLFIAFSDNNEIINVYASLDGEILQINVQKSLPIPAVHTSCDSNWAGYVINPIKDCFNGNPAIDEVWGSICGNKISHSCEIANPNSVQYDWIGIGGYYGCNYLAQAGIGLCANGYFAWIYFCPYGWVAITPIDDIANTFINMEVVYCPSNNTWLAGYCLYNTTTNELIAYKWAPQPSNFSIHKPTADFIVENSPGCIPLYTKQTFTQTSDLFWYYNDENSQYCSISLYAAYQNAQISCPVFGNLRLCKVIINTPDAYSCISTVCSQSGFSVTILAR